MALNPNMRIGLGLHTLAHEYADRNLTSDERLQFLHGASWATYQIKQRHEPILGVALCGKHNFALPAGTTSSLDSANCVVCKALNGNKCSSEE